VSLIPIRDWPYEKLLERAYSMLPEKVEYKGRFQVPKPRVLIVGDKTIIQNFKQICDVIRREPKVVSKWFAKELAVPAQIGEKGELVLTGRFNTKIIEKLLNMFVDQYVICPTCKGPDTELIRLDRKVWILRCHVCGAETPVPPL
jgi:translation initiation factor 2 subunit 2